MGRRTDDQVCADVAAALKSAAVDELAITISMRRGVVELGGELSSHSERLAAATAAKHAAAPAPVRSALTVAPAGRDFRLTDADIAVEVARAIDEADVVPGSVRFDIANRIVTLRGTVATADERARVRHLVQCARGVDFIDNRMEVVPSETSRA